MIDLDLSFRWLSGRCHGNQRWAKLAQTDLHSAGLRSKTVLNMADTIQKYSMEIC